jgi:Zn-dependent peptidase ImmA (M78 family)
MKDLTFVFGPGMQDLPEKEAARNSSRVFVRSEGQLGICEESRKPTGHKLTAWEAYSAYGVDVLQEAVEYGSAILKRTRNSTVNALKYRRNSIGLSDVAVENAANVPKGTVEVAEDSPHQIPFEHLTRIAFALGLDERLLAFNIRSGGDSNLAVRLRTLVAEPTSSVGRISQKIALLFAEASSIARTQLRLQEWLQLSRGSDKFQPYSDYGSPQLPAWRIGYNLAHNARSQLQLGNDPISSMRHLTEEQLGIPVIQARLPARIAGATVMTMDERGREARGIVLNTIGANANVWIRRITLAHELGHLLYDPEANLQNVRIDSYLDNQMDPEVQGQDFVEQRANAFAIAFLAPTDAVRKLAPTPVTEESVERVMSTFGISHTSARYHINNCHYRQYSVPSKTINVSQTDEQTAAENFTIDYFPISKTPEQRRGRFAGLVVACYKKGIISSDTAALYLACSTEDFQKSYETLLSIYGF